MPLINNFVYEINNNPEFVGDILEFGTGSGNSTLRIGYGFNKGKIFTYDGFVGLPKTNKVVPVGTNWEEGNLKFSEQATRDKLRPFNHIIVEKCMTWDLKTPKEYGISRISGVNIDVDLYEGTLDALNFMDKCEWTNVLIRFDDWGYYVGTEQIKEEVDQHEKAAFFDFIERTNYKYSFYEDLCKSTDYRQTLIKVSR
jgi:hypothetical protein